jgi:hypothetical protein
MTLSFNARSEAGALLMTKHQTFSEDMELRGTFSRQLLKHHSKWLSFAQDQGRPVELEDLILVTGLDLTKDFAMLSFANNSSDFDINFQVGVSQYATGSISAWGSWHTTSSTQDNWGPQHTATPSALRADRALRSITSEGDSAEAIPSDEYRQCVFVRGYRIRRRFGVWPQVQTAAAEPQDPPYYRDNDAEVAAVAVEGIAEVSEMI